ncbi:MAG TPA: hypothetical protein VKT27_02405 [Candidatus Binataceae bacterium]|nr:hypothetical protein [Candidatus Binataceae bacterium]
MIPSLEELRKMLVPDLVPSAGSTPDSQGSTASVRSVKPASPEFPVICKSSRLFTPRTGLMCRICLTPPEHAVLLRPNNMRASQIVRSSLEGWLKHDLVFFGESYLCERCAKEAGFI